MAFFKCHFSISIFLKKPRQKIKKNNLKNLKSNIIKIFFCYFSLFFLRTLQLVIHVLPRSNLVTKNSKPRLQEHKWKKEKKIKLNTNRKNEEQWTKSNHQTQIHHNRPTPSTQPNHPNSSNLRENPNSTQINCLAPSNPLQTSKKTQSN